MSTNTIQFWDKLTEGGMAGWVVVLLILLLSIIEISPIKLNPIGAFLGWVGKKLNGKMQQQIDDLQKQITDLQKQMTDMWVNSHRTAILIFAREARDGVEHSSDEWVNVLNQAEDYEQYVHERKITNGIVTQDTEFIRHLYQELSREHRI